MPERIQRSRAKGWRMPVGATYVGRPGPFGNPFPWEGTWAAVAAVAAGFTGDAAGRRASAVAHYRAWLTGEVRRGPHADDKGDDLIVYADGSERSTAEQGRRLAAFLAVSLGSRLHLPPPPALERIRAELRGHDLACWCALGQPCHADVLLELANG